MLEDTTVPLHALYAKYFPNGAFEERFALSNLERILSVYLRNTNLFTAYPPIAGKQSFCIPLTEGVEFFGEFDGLVRDAQGIKVLETKTTGFMSNEWREQWRTSSQLMGYVL